ncbi:ABC transporter ATP-binding protein [Metabacillus arenae]|uniref:ABC transporter ATP-binding protein n=1 Tax=Metabacillus arenae TaxID=2771434 RepID=A0A926NIQ9_9BACI|nr:ABC transporter ATP-binding protein [Metabacillus arenae]MBD1382449.1 ABC transporter ATP-binding protein [Metabacillus arenae]
MIELQNVTKTYKIGGNTNYALHNVSFQIQPNEFVGIIGKSGSGKSTLLNMLTGIDFPSSGSIHINGTELSSLSNRRLTKWRSSNIGIVFQSFHLIPTLTLLENVMLPMELSRGVSRKARKRRASELLESVGLKERIHYFPDYVSGGEKQRAAIARALANDPPLLMADEPTGNLDSENSQSIFALFEQLVGEGKTIVMVTHDQDLAERVSRTIHVKDGKVSGDNRIQDHERLI